MSVSGKFGVSIVVVSNRALNCAHFCFNKMPIKTHDDANAKFITTLEETHSSAVRVLVKAAKVLVKAESAFEVQVVKVLAETVGERVEAVRELVKAVIMLVEAVRMLVEAVRVLV